MTQAEKIERMRKIFDELCEVAESKGHDYAGDQEALSNLADFGWQGVVVRISDKYHRLKNFVKQGKMKVSDESVIDTLNDMTVYATLCRMMYEDEKKDVKVTSADDFRRRLVEMEQEMFKKIPHPNYDGQLESRP